jgi:metal transporter CNNM
MLGESASFRGGPNCVKPQASVLYYNTRYCIVAQHYTRGTTELLAHPLAHPLAPMYDPHNCSCTAGELPPLTEPWWLYTGAALGCVVGAALAAGLTMGLVSLADSDLETLILMEEDDCDGAEAKSQLRRLKGYANRLLPLKKDHHLLLVTLLLVNAAVNEALPIFLDRIVPYPWIAILLSVTLVLIFGEIIPSAIFTGPNQLRIAASFSCVVCAALYVLRPIAWPIARVLDCCLGHGETASAGSGARYERAKMKALLRHHRELGDAVEAHEKVDDAVSFLGIAKDQLEIMQGALDLRTTTCEEACLSMDKVFMLPKTARLDHGTMADILARGFSRVPVYEGSKHNVSGLLLVKRLIVLSPEDGRLVSSVCSRKPAVVGLKTSLLDALNEFQDGRSHLAIVCNQPDLVRDCLKCDREVPVNVHMAGIITIEDVIERIIKGEIDDETEPKRMQSLNNPFTAYTKSGALAKLRRLARVKAIAAGFKRTAQERAANGGMAARGFEDPALNPEELEAANGQRIAPVSGASKEGAAAKAKQGAAPSSQQVARFSAGLRKLGKSSSQQRRSGPGGKGTAESGGESLEQPLLQ